MRANGMFTKIIFNLNSNCMKLQALVYFLTIFTVLISLLLMGCLFFSQGSACNAQGQRMLFTRTKIQIYFTSISTPNTIICRDTHEPAISFQICISLYRIAQVHPYKPNGCFRNILSFLLSSDQSQNIGKSPFLQALFYSNEWKSIHVRLLKQTTIVVNL